MILQSAEPISLRALFVRNKSFANAGRSPNVRAIDSHLLSENAFTDLDLILIGVYVKLEQPVIIHHRWSNTNADAKTLPFLVMDFKILDVVLRVGELKIDINVTSGRLRQIVSPEYHSPMARSTYEDCEFARVSARW